MNLFIITINYNGSESTTKLLKSLAGQTDPAQSSSADHQPRGQALSGTSKDFQVIVVDNASDEDDFIDLREGLGDAIFISNDKNLGFSGGNNIAIKKALENGADWVVLLNNDTVVESGFIGVLKAKLRGLDGIVGIPLVENDRTAYYGKIEWLKPTLKHGYTPPYSEYLRRDRSFYAIGGAMAIHRDVFNKIGFLDEKYFLYFEDADFNIRAKKEGIPIGFIDEPKVRHQEVSKTTKKLGAPLLLRYHYRNALYFNHKNGTGYIKFIIWPWSFWVMKKQMWKILFFYKQEMSLAILMGIIDFYKGKMGKIK